MIGSGRGGTLSGAAASLRRSKRGNMSHMLGRSGIRPVDAKPLRLQDPPEDDATEMGLAVMGMFDGCTMPGLSQPPGFRSAAMRRAGPVILLVLTALLLKPLHDHFNRVTVWARPVTIRDVVKRR
jgi:hypothetical protein